MIFVNANMIFKTPKAIAKYNVISYLKYAIIINNGKKIAIKILTANSIHLTNIRENRDGLNTFTVKSITNHTERAVNDIVVLLLSKKQQKIKNKLIILHTIRK